MVLEKRQLKQEAGAQPELTHYLKKMARVDLCRLYICLKWASDKTEDKSSFMKILNYFHLSTILDILITVPLIDGLCMKLVRTKAFFPVSSRPNFLNPESNTNSYSVVDQSRKIHNFYVLPERKNFITQNFIRQ